MTRMATGEHDFEAELTREAREQAERDERAAKSKGFTGFELRGNALVCKCHGREILRFDPQTLAAHHPDE